ncbi:MAG: hypothetical protein IT530_16055 [Burkholderiales bacterium]|nr:hypothetical protein [Burkholderiales bacterium]
MVAPLVPILLQAAQFVPQLLRWAGAENAADVAEKVGGLAQSITGAETPELALERLRSDARLAEQFAMQAQALALAELDAEIRQLEAINATIRAEATSQDPYTRRWRPTWGYMTSVCWLVQTCAISWAIVMKPAEATQILEAVGSLSVQWITALSVLGVAVATRTSEKRAALGIPQPLGIKAAIAQRIAGQPQGDTR